MRRRLFALVAAAALVAAPAARAAPRTWSVTVLGDADDPRYAAVQEAIAHWNEQLAAAGASLRFGAITRSDARLSEVELVALSDGMLSHRWAARPHGLDAIPGDVVIAFSHSDLVSVGFPPRRFGHGLVVLRRPDVPPLSLPNVARNVVTHELGHVLGLQHNADPAMLMCGRPAACRPALFQSDTTRFFPLTDSEKHALATWWR